MQHAKNDSKPAVRSGLLRMLYDTAFYLPDVGREMCLLATQAERDAARWHVWRRLFRSAHYWLLCAAVVAVMIPLFLGGMWLATWTRLRVGSGIPQFETLFLTAYGAVCVAIFSVAGMWPLRRMVLRELRGYLNSRQIPVCVHCGYDLRGNSSDRCPECGHALTTAAGG